MLIQKEPIFNRIGQPIYPPVWTLAAAGNVSLAVAIATQMAGEDSLKSLDLYVNGFNADGSKRESVVDGGGAV